MTSRLKTEASIEVYLLQDHEEQLVFAMPSGGLLPRNGEKLTFSYKGAMLTGRVVDVQHTFEEPNRDMRSGEDFRHTAKVLFAVWKAPDTVQDQTEHS